MISPFLSFLDFFPLSIVQPQTLGGAGFPIRNGLALMNSYWNFKPVKDKVVQKMKGNKPGNHKIVKFTFARNTDHQCYSWYGLIDAVSNYKSINQCEFLPFASY